MIDDVGGPHAPETGDDVTVTDRIGGFVEVQALRVEIVIGDAIRRQNHLCAQFGARSGRADRHALSAQVLHAGDPAIGQRDQLHGVWIDRRQGACFTNLAAFKGTGAGIGLIDRIGQAGGMAMSLSPRWTKAMFSTEAPVTSTLAL